MDDFQFERSQVFRNSEDQAIASRLRGTGYGLDSYEATYMRRTNQLQGYKDLGIDLLSGIRDGALSGSENLGEAIMQGVADAATSYATKLSDKLIEDIVTGGMKMFGLEDLAMPEMQNVGTVNMTAATVIVGGAGVNNLLGGAGVPAPNNPAAGGDPWANMRLGAAPVEPVARAALPAIGTTQGGIPLANVTAGTLVAQVNAAYADRFQGFINELQASGYQINSLGGYNHRNIAGTNRLSNHAYGNAIDINPLTNPDTGRGGRLITDMPPGVSEMAARYGIGWGGDWNSKKDAMHFEVLGKKMDAAGVSVDHMTTNAIGAGNSLGTLGKGFDQVGSALSRAASGGGGGGGGGGLFGGISNWIANLFGGPNTYGDPVGAGGDPWGGLRFAASPMMSTHNPGYANGTENAPPGWAWIGERGPELMRMRGGETIRNNATSKAMAAGGGVTLNHQTVIENRAGVEVSEETTQDESGGYRTHVIIEKRVAAAINRPGSDARKAVMGMGGRPSRIKR
ncbi:M15 family metallopeptidase [Mesorhizobium yinganensis]|uniref:M15 family metallopeptidase n=1 Tax=Mesorhizobium yinganensis TaxID=3157707 RepID=UPI0032B7EF3A